MIHTCSECEYTVLVADLITTLMTFEKDNKLFLLKIWYNNRDLPFKFNNDCVFEFLQEGIRIDTMNNEILYLWYDAIECFKVEIE
ncbi:hypothetical protein [Methanobrevibacter sp.]